MNVILPIAEKKLGESMDTFRVLRAEVACELAAAPDGQYLAIRLLAAGAGLQAGDELVVHAASVTGI